MDVGHGYLLGFGVGLDNSFLNYNGVGICHIKRSWG